MVTPRSVTLRARFEALRALQIAANWIQRMAKLPRIRTNERSSSKSTALVAFLLYPCKLWSPSRKDCVETRLYIAKWDDLFVVVLREFVSNVELYILAP